MSYDLNVYGARDSLGQKEDLVGLLSKKGWQVRFLSGSAFLEDELRPVLSSTGPLEDWCLIAGWKKKGRYAEVLAAWVDRRKLHHFQKMTAETACFGCCELSIGPLPNGDTNFYLRTSAGRSPVSFEFQHTVWEAIGELTDGLMDNPQEGAVKSGSASLLLEEQIAEDSEEQTLPPSGPLPPVNGTGADLVAYWEREGMIGSRPDITDSLEHARAIRCKAERRVRE